MVEDAWVNGGKYHKFKVVFLPGVSCRFFLYGTPDLLGRQRAELAAIG